MTNPDKLAAAIIGARSYTGRELMRIARRHSRLCFTTLQARVETPEPIADTFGELRGAGFPDITAISVKALPEDTKAAFLCMPHTAGAEIARGLIERGIRVFDLSADFRFRDHRTYESVYGVAHPAPDLNRTAVYGLPEINRATIRGASLVACPGCYPTSVILALAPLMKRDLIEPGSVIADCKSGVSGAGRGLSDTVHYCHANESIAAYKVAEHRHQPEIEEQLSRLACEDHTLTFVPHLTPMDRGILSTCYARLKEPAPLDALRSLYAQFYRQDHFVRLLPPGQLPATKAVTNTNCCDLALRMDERHARLIVVSAIDNLWKGASGQAVQCFNISFGLDERDGLL